MALRCIKTSFGDQKKKFSSGNVNVVRVDPGRDPLGLEEYHPVTVHICVKAKKRNTEKGSDLLKKKMAKRCIKMFISNQVTDVGDRHATKHTKGHSQQPTFIG